jgi:hypothetical protein
MEKILAAEMAEAFCIDPDRLVSPVPQGIDLACPLCLDIPMRPVQLPCEHLFCRPCLAKALSSRHGGRACPTCKAASATKDIAPLPRMVQNLVSALQVGELPLRVPIAVA